MAQNRKGAGIEQTPMKLMAQNRKDWARHIYRELNGEADALANLHCYSAYFDEDNHCFTHYRIFFDGSVTPSRTGGGWILKGAYRLERDVPEAWHCVAKLSFPMESD